MIWLILRTFYPPTAHLWDSSGYVVVVVYMANRNLNKSLTCSGLGKSEIQHSPLRHQYLLHPPSLVSKKPKPGESKLVI